MRFLKLATLLLLVLFTSSTLQAQIDKPVNWKFSSKHVKGDEYDIYISTSIKKGWYVYSQHNPVDGPVPTTFEFNKTSGVTFVGNVNESGNKKSGFDDVFKMNVTKFSKKSSVYATNKSRRPYSTV